MSDTTLFPPFQRSRLQRIAVALGGALLLGAFLVGHTTLILRTRDLTPNLATIVANLLNGLVWAGLAPLAAYLGRRLPIVGSRWGRHLLAHASFALVADAIVGVGVLIVTRPIDPGSPPVSFLFVNNFLAALPFYLLLWLVAVALTHAYDHARRSKERERQAAQLETQLARAQLDALRAQLNPHFLFNALNAASTLMSRDVKAARTVLVDLSDLLRLALDHFDEPEIPLDDELNFLRHYLDIEQTRFQDRLKVSFEIEPGTGDALVPPLVLQPLVENALKHAVAPNPNGGHVVIQAHTEGTDVLVLAVADDGPGLADGAIPSRGIGLRNTKERLDSLYGASASLELATSTQGGLAAVVRLPHHTHPFAERSSLA